MKLENAVSFQA